MWYLNYTSYVSNAFGNAVVVFDCNHGFSTEDEAHNRGMGHDTGVTKISLQLTGAGKSHLQDCVPDPATMRCHVHLHVGSVKKLLVGIHKLSTPN